jgi:large subunit ribosomal protein L35
MYVFFWSSAILLVVWFSSFTSIDPPHDYSRQTGTSLSPGKTPQSSSLFGSLPVSSAGTMPKLKNHSGTKKRARRTGSGKIAMKRNSRNHLLQQKSRRQKSLSRTLVPGNAKEQRTLVSLLPYAK